MIDKLIKIKEIYDSETLNNMEIYTKIAEYPFSVTFLWLFSIVGALLVVAAVLVLLGVFILELLFWINKKIRTKIRKIKSELAEYNLNKNNNLLIDTKYIPKDLLKKNKKKLKKLKKYSTQIENKVIFLEDNGLDDMFMCFLKSLMIMCFGMICFVVIIGIEFNINNSYNEKNTDLELESINIYKEEIKNIPINKVEIQKLTKTGKNEYVIILKDKKGKIIEVDFTGDVIETDNFKGVFYEYKIYPLKEDYKGTYFEKEHEFILYGVQEEVIKISKENMLNIYNNNVYVR